MFHFADAVTAVTRSKGPLVVGIDPSFSLLPKEFIPKSFSSTDCVETLFRFSSLVVEAVADIVGIVKFQSAYYEQCGASGVVALARAIKYAKSKGLLVILDAKRGDIGSTSAAYASAYLAGKTTFENGLRIESDLEVDCLTVNPFLGLDSILPFVEVCQRTGKGIFLLVRTSNPSAVDLQNIEKSGRSVSQYLARQVEELGASMIGESGFSNIGAVVGATYPEEARDLRANMPHALILVPGAGSQGGTVESAIASFSPEGLGAIVSVSRAITYPDAELVSEHGYSNAVRLMAEQYQSQLRDRLPE